jgi:hypothetical protein
MGTCLVGLAIILAFNVGRDWRDWQDSETWLTTSSTEFVRKPKTDYIRYTYLVAGREYQGERLYFFQKLLYDYGYASQWYYDHNLAQGDQVTVYYDPDAPERSVLEPKVDVDRVRFWGFTLIYACLALLLPVAFFSFIWWRFIKAFR